MKLFDLQRDILIEILPSLLDFKSLRALSQASVKFLELYRAKILTFGGRKNEVRKYRVRKLLYLVVRGELYFKTSFIRECIYKELKISAKESNVDANERCLRYLLLVILGVTVGETASVIKEYKQRFWMQVQLLDDNRSMLYAALYAKKNRLPNLLDNIVSKIRPKELRVARERAIYNVVVLSPNLNDLLQGLLGELAVSLRDEKRVYSHFLSGSRRYIQCIMLASSVSKNTLEINFEALLPYLKNTQHLTNLSRLLLILEQYQKNTPSSRHKLYMDLLSQLTRYCLLSKYEVNLKEGIKDIVHRLVRGCSEINPMLNQNQHESLFFYMSGLSHYSVTNGMVGQFLEQFAIRWPDVTKALRRRVVEISLQSSEVEILCLFALVKLCPRNFDLNIEFIADWLIKKASILESPLSLRLLSSVSDGFTNSQVAALYDSICRQLSENDKLNLEELIAEMSRCLPDRSNIISRSDIIRPAVFKMLSMVHKSLDKSQCQEAVSLIANVAYGNGFSLSFDERSPDEAEVLPHLCHQLTARDKVVILVKSRSGYGSFFNWSKMGKVRPNCSYYLIDDKVLTLLHGAKIDLVHREMFPCVNLSKLNDEQRKQFVKKTLAEIHQLSDHVGEALIKNVVSSILLLVKYMDWKQCLLVAHYFSRNINVYNMSDEEVCQILDLILTVKGPSEFIGAMFKAILNANNGAVFSLGSRFTSDIMCGFENGCYLPSECLEALSPTLDATNFNQLYLSIKIVANMLADKKITMGGKLRVRLRNAINHMLELEGNYLFLYDVLIVASKCFSVDELIQWVKVLLPKVKSQMLGNGSANFNSVGGAFLAKIDLSFDEFLIFLDSPDEEIVRLGHYYIVKKATRLTNQELLKYYTHINLAIDMNKFVPCRVISILAYYRKPIHDDLLSRITSKLFFNCSEDRRNKIISTISFTKLMKPLLRTYDDVKIKEFRSIIRGYICRRYKERYRKVELLAELSELCDAKLFDVTSQVSHLLLKF